METKTLDELKLMAANKLPDKFAKYSTGICGSEVSDDEIDKLNMAPCDWVLAWKDTKIKIIETEWPHIVHLLEEKMDCEQCDDYEIRLGVFTAKNRIWHKSLEQKLTAMYNSGFLKD